MNLTNDGQLRKMIVDRMGEVFNSPNRTANLKFSGKQGAFIKDAASRGVIISNSRLSKYLNGLKGGITEDQILWVATRLGIFVNVGYGKPVLINGKLSYEVGDYNESECLARLARIFPEPIKVEVNVKKKKK